MKTAHAQVTRLEPRSVPAPVVKPTAAILAGTSVDPELRRRMIAEAAYYRAEARNFADGYELEDWIEAEAEVDHLLRPSEIDTLAQ